MPTHNKTKKKKKHVCSVAREDESCEARNKQKGMACAWCLSGCHVALYFSGALRGVFFSSPTGLQPEGESCR